MPPKRPPSLSSLSPSTTSLNLSNCGLTSSTADSYFLSLPSRVPHLRTLDVSMNKLGLHGMVALTCALRDLAELRRLDAGFVQLEASGARALSEVLSSLPHLTHLHLFSNRLGRSGTRALARAMHQSCASLQSLHLFDNALGLAGVAAIADALPHLPALRMLDLGRNQIDSAGAEALALRLPCVPALEKLSLASNRIGYKGAMALADALPHLRCLRDLQLQGNLDVGATSGAVLLAHAMLLGGLKVRLPSGASGAEVSHELIVQTAALHRPAVITSLQPFMATLRFPREDTAAARFATNSAFDVNVMRIVFSLLC